MPYQEGDTSPPHINVHNEVVPQVQALADEMGVDVDLPPVRSLGDSGHVDDHNLIHTALDKIAAEGSAGASWAQVISAPDAVTGSYYDDKGGQWAFYEWNAPGTFDVEVSGGLLWCLVVGAGSRGWHATADGHVSQGQPGQVREGLWEFVAGTHTVTVGDIGTGTEAASVGGGSSVGDYKVFNTHWGSANGGRGSDTNETPTPYYSSITGDNLGYAPGLTWKEAGNGGELRPGQGGNQKVAGGLPTAGTVIIATRIDVPTLPPAPPRLEVAPVVAKPVTISGPEVQEWLVRDKQGNRKVVYFLPGNTGTARSLALTEEGAEALQARRELLDAIATTDVPEDFEGDPVTLLPKKLRAELRGFVEVRRVPQAAAVFSVTLGAGVLPGVMVGSGGSGGMTQSSNGSNGAGGAGGVIGQGAHVPVILPVQGTATYTVTVGSTTPNGTLWYEGSHAQHTTIAVQGQTPFTAAVGGGRGVAQGTNVSYATSGGSGGGGQYAVYSDTDNVRQASSGIPGQGYSGNYRSNNGYGTGGGGGYGSGNENTSNGGAGFDLATALNLDANDGITGSFLAQVSVDGWIAGGGAGGSGTATAGGGAYGGGHGKDYSGAGGAAGGTGKPGNGGAGAVYLITDPT